ncbi:hypothetical protein [Sedimentibacter sp.]|uniref:hypothetical protein n=1 Tax=Sedimentibacter sp. TaxID=1960295 RepID=UPI000ED224EF|nr:hypothetical protein [Sedimentibacter sp.]HCX62902.1 hypothetical protein [Clostridiales bacterium]
MKIGIKYCGGCNPNYNRSEAVSRIVSRYPEIEFEPAKHDTRYDHILIINGCSRSCAGYEELKANNKIFINSVKDIGKFFAYAQNDELSGDCE